MSLNLRIGSSLESDELKVISQMIGAPISNCPRCNCKKFAQASTYEPDPSREDVYGTIEEHVIQCTDCNFEMDFQVTNGVIGFNSQEEVDAYIPAINNLQIRFVVKEFSIVIFQDEANWTTRLSCEYRMPNQQEHLDIKKLLPLDITRERLNMYLLFS